MSKLVKDKENKAGYRGRIAGRYYKLRETLDSRSSMELQEGINGIC
jgi:hypothetical protein